MLPVTLAEKYVSLFVSTFLIGTVMLLGCAILSNIFMQLAIPLFFTEETDEPVFLFLGGGYDFKQLIVQMVIAFYVALWTVVVMLRKQYSKTQFWLIVVFMYFFLCVAGIVYVWIRCSQKYHQIHMVDSFRGLEHGSCCYGL